MSKCVREQCVVSEHSHQTAWIKARAGSKQHKREGGGEEA